jgi:lipopolysaccharide biosynthesis regulator YciM
MISSILAIGYLANINRDVVTINLAFKTYEISKFGLALLSWAAGALIVIFIVAIKDTRRYFQNWKASKIHKKESKIQEMYSKGVNALLAKRNAEAMNYFDKILMQDPYHIDSLLRLGNLFHREKNINEAIRLHQKARDLSPTNIEILFALEADYEEARRLEDAIQILKDILNIDETNLNALYRMRDIYQRQGRWEDANMAQIKILKATSSSEDKAAEHQRLIGMRYELGRSLLEDGNLDKAKRIFKGVLRLDKDFIPAYLGLGEVYLQEGDIAGASELWEKSYQTTSSIIFLLRLEDLYLSLGEPNKIIEIYQKTLSTKPNDLILNFFLGKLYYRLEMIDDAYDILTSMNSGAENLPDLHKLIGNIYLRRGSPDKAAKEFKKALRFRKKLVVPYRCSKCEYQSTDWSGRCPQCGKWNTYNVYLEKPC